MEEEIPANSNKTGYKNPPKEYQFKPGQSGNPSGRPKGTLKDYARQKFMAMSDDEKEAFLSGIEEYKIWTMAEGNPESRTDLYSGGVKIDFSKIDPKQIALADEFEQKFKESL